MRFRRTTSAIALAGALVFGAAAAASAAPLSYPPVGPVGVATTHSEGVAVGETAGITVVYGSPGERAGELVTIVVSPTFAIEEGHIAIAGVRSTERAVDADGSAMFDVTFAAAGSVTIEAFNADDELIGSLNKLVGDSYQREALRALQAGEITSEQFDAHVEALRAGTATPAPTPTATQTAAPAPGLPVTGAELVLFGTGAALLIAVGTTVVVGARRRAAAKA